MPQKPKPSTAAQRADEALEKAAPSGKSPARKALAFLLEGSHDLPVENDSTQLNSPDSTQLDSTQLNSAAPSRDFNKRANSIERDALPAGLFPGTSKKLYDALYLRTRGAVVPVRSIQATRAELMRWAGIGGLNTFLSHMKHFTRIGLIIRSFEIGDKEGAFYEVRLPEEIDLTRLDSTQLNSTQKRVHDSTQKLMRVESSNPIENKGTYEIHKTSFKTDEKNIDDDDAALAAMARTLKRAAREITGKEVSFAESERWKELADVLIAELKIAAARTTVSSVPAFLAEHLRRRLWKLDKKQARAEGRELPDEAASAPQVDASACPDCAGSGWHYPEGPERGVAKCKHVRMKLAEMKSAD
jgi:hypothetical protein